ncbi:tetratricopeptide repeat protein [Streptomyces asiaticus]|uniref:tetratricopeptide repeat protein n=1 Tax=Streptomyces asiaticus TaxID=114695 RepID=UPI0037F7169F
MIHHALPANPKTNTGGWPRWRTLLPHIDAYLTHTHPDTDTTETHVILHTAGRFLHGQGQLSQAIQYAHRSAITSARLNGEDDSDTLSFSNNLASAYESAGDLGRAIPLYEQTLTDTIRVLGEDHPTTRVVRDNLHGARSDPG